MHGDGVSNCFYAENGNNYATIENQDMGLFTISSSWNSGNSTEVNRGLINGILYKFAWTIILNVSYINIINTFISHLLHTIFTFFPPGLLAALFWLIPWLFLDYTAPYDCSNSTYRNNHNLKTRKPYLWADLAYLHCSSGISGSSAFLSCTPDTLRSFQASYSSKKGTLHACILRCKGCYRNIG